MSWGRVGHPRDPQSAQDIDVVVLDINREKERVSLASSRSWPTRGTASSRSTLLAPRQRQGRQPGSLRRVCRMEPGVEGLVHVTEFVLDKRIAKPADVLKQDQEIEARCWHQREEQKISLGLRQLESNPWISLRRNTRLEPRSKERFAISPATVRLSSWKKVWTA